MTVALPQPGTTVVVGDHTYVVRRTEQVNAYGQVGHRVYVDIDGRRVYSPMTFTEWKRLTKGTA